jgi:hypothetical protein
VLGDVEDPTAAAIGGGACILTLVAYCIYQVRIATCIWALKCTTTRC